MSTVPVALVDREAELARLDALVQDAHRGEGRLLAIEGEPGIGKTALVRVAIDRASMAGARVLTARGTDLERGYAFGVARQLLEAEAAAAPELLTGRAALAAPVLGGEAGIASVDREAALHGMYWLLAGLVDAGPMLLAIDDVHWADDESVALLRFLAVRLSGLRLSAVVATRPPPADAVLAGLIADPAVEVLRPRALTRSASAVLLARRLDAEPPADFADACHADTGGNPFLVEQLARAVRAEGIAPDAARPALLADLRIDPVARLLLSRLKASERALARAVAILGDGSAAGTAGALAGLDAGEVERSADALAAGGVLDDGRPLRFRHPLVRGAVLAEMPAGEQARARAAAARVLRERDAPPERVAAQLVRLEPSGDAEDVETLVAAAREAAGRGGPASAATLLVRALREPLAADRAVELLMDLGACESDLGRREAADRFLEAARVAPDDERRTEAAIAAGYAAALDPVRAARALELLDAIATEGAPAELRLRFLNARLAASLTDLERFQAIATGPDVPDLANGSSPAESLLLAHLTRARLEAGASAAEVGEVAERALATPVLDEPGWFVTMIIALLAIDRHSPARRLTRLALEQARERGALRSYLFAQSWEARIALVEGVLPEAEELATAALAAGEPVADWWRLVPASVLLEATLDQGRTDDAARVWAATGLGESVPVSRPLTPLLQARARLRLASGDAEGSLADLTEATRRLGPTGAGINGLAHRMLAAQALSALGRDDEAGATATAAVAVARRFGAGSHLGASLRVLGRLTGDELALREAVTQLGDGPRRLEHARALVDLGALLRRRGERRAAREPLRDGHRLAVTCGALGLAAHARDELAASGARIPRRDPTQPDALTPSEQRIAKLAAGGASNREIAQSLFLTVKTVEMHLSNAYRKLDIRSRRDLPEALASRPAAS